MDTAPITFTVAAGSTPIRIGTPFTTAPYRIINTSTNGTVWISNDPGVSSGIGSPLYPGTSMGRNQPEFFVAPDSGNTGPVTLVADPYVLDWNGNPIAIAVAVANSGLILIDNPQLLASYTYQATSSVVEPAVNISTYQSLSLVVYRSVTPAHTLTVTLQWLDSVGGNPLGIDTFTWTSGDSTSLQTMVPCRGAFVQVRITSNVNPVSADTVILVGSHRPYDKMMTMPSTGVPGGGVPLALGDRMLCTAVNAAVASGGQLTATPGARYDGPIVITSIVFGAAAAAPHLIEAVDSVTGFGFGYDQPAGTLALGANRSVSTLHCVAPRNTWTATVSNLASVAQTVQIEVVAAPEGS